MPLDQKADILWNTLSVNETTGHAGLIWSADGNADGEETVEMITMFHQLHCLTGLRNALQASVVDGICVGDR